MKQLPLKMLREISCPIVKRQEKSFANFILVGPCNLSCKFCVATLAPNIPQLQGNSLNTPVAELPNISMFFQRLQEDNIGWVMLTGLNTDPLLYNYLEDLVEVIHNYGLKCALRSNGYLFFERKEIINKMDKVSYSISTLNSKTAKDLIEIDYIPNWKKILKQTIPPVKINTVICPENVTEINNMLNFFSSQGVERVALREAFGFEPVNYILPFDAKFIKYFCDNPVFSYKGMEVTLWDVCTTTVDSLNYIASTGEIFSEYRLWDIMKQEE